MSQNVKRAVNVSIGQSKQEGRAKLGLGRGSCEFLQVRGWKANAASARLTKWTRLMKRMYSLAGTVLRACWSSRLAYPDLAGNLEEAVESIEPLA